MPASTFRVVTWALLPVLAALYFVVLSSPIPSELKLIPLELIYCTPIAITVAFSFMAVGRSHDVERTFWFSLCAANAILLGCELLLIYWVYAIDPAGPPRVSWPFHAMHGVAAVFFISLLLAMSRFWGSTAATKLRWVLDGAAVMVVLGVLIIELYSRPIMEPAGATIPEVLLGTGYPLFGLLMLIGTLGNVVGFKIDRWRAWDRLVAISLTIYALAISLWPLWYPTAVDTSRNYERGVLDLVQFAGHWLLMAAAVYRLTEPAGWRIRPLPPVMSTRRWVSLALPAASVVAIPAILWLGLTRHDGTTWFVIYAAIATVLTLLVLARSVAMAMEHGVLFSRAITDPLTGVYNHRFFHAHLAEQLDQAGRYDEPLALLSFDIDDFGRFNERFGHLAGDHLLAEVAAIMSAACGSGCTVSRLGGDEFAVLAPNTDAVGANLLAARLLDMIAIQAGSSPGSVGVSAGVAVYPTHAQDAEQLLRFSDGALFHSKETGKGRSTMYDGERVPDLSARERIERLELQSRLASVRALAAAADARDGATQDHSRSVAELSAAIARALGLPDVTVRSIEMGALLYEVGHIALVDGPAEHAGGLGPADDRRHTILGQQILSSAGLADLAPLARSHHERWDGGGYPDGLAGKEIPLAARIVAVANEYDSLISGLAPGIARTSAQALEEVRTAAGTAFDPEIVDALASVVGQRAVTSCA